MNNKDTPKKETEVNAGEICRRIETESDAQSRDILSRAKKEAARILEEARNEADKNKAVLFREADRTLAKLKERIVSSLNLEKKKVVMAEKEKFAGLVLQGVKKEAESFRENGEYRGFLKKQIVSGITLIGDPSVEVYYSFLDERLLTGSFRKEIEDACRDTIQGGVSLQFIKAEFKDIGIIIQSKDGRLISDRRFLSFLKTAYEDVYMRLLKEAV
ncbi:MAG: V-type ATP synthase subunit E family protein [Candidatus Omnitrophota bacterium]|jgi:vacuolar-type H+-ATPase subunit E/Vma4